nr:translation initiation factor IF-2 N-terminal domain-containing protein [Actinopolyspora mortivallis]
MASRRDGRAQGENTQRTFELPPKMRVHALAKMLEVTSREVIAKLGELGHSVRSAQANITREVALEVVGSLRPERVEPTANGGRPPERHTRRGESADTGAREEPATASEAEERASSERALNGSSGAEGRQSASAEVPAEESGEAESDPAQEALAPTFAPPQAMFLPPRQSETTGETDTATEETGESAPAEEQSAAPESTERNENGESSGGTSTRRRRRRGRRGRGRGRGGDEEGTSSAGEATASPTATGEETAKSGKSTKKDRKDRKAKKDKNVDPGAETSAKDEGETASGASGSESPGAEEETEATSVSRRRRRRRRKSSAESDNLTREDDPPNTVVHVRESTGEGSRQEAEDEVRAIKGSTRLEAKRQRRRDGREAGRRRASVLSESEFLARRESVDRKMIVRENDGQTQVAVLEDDILVENFVTSAGSDSLVGNVYLGRVQNVLPSMEAAFVDIGRGRNAVLYAGEVDWEAAGLAGKSRRIEQALSTGDSVLVQVTKDPLGHKGARLTTQISLPGRFLVYVPGGGATGISRKLPDNERKRLKEILKRIVPDESGVIIRTASEGTSEQALDRDVRRLQAQWEVIKEKAETPNAQAPQLLYAEPDLLVKVVRDLFTEDFSALTVQGNQAWETIEAYVQHVAPELLGRLHKHVSNTDVFTEYRVDEQITKALDRKVWLPSGGYLVIDRTEAMTVIDVNTGKFTGSGGNLEETVTRNNLEAAEEIVRQLRLRDIGGIVVIDFIDMVLESNRDLVLRRLTECLGRDRTRHQVAEVTSLGLVQMTRKRVGTGLLEAYSSTCEHCRGRGVLVSTEPIDHSHHGGGGGGSRRNKQRGKSSQQDNSGGQQRPEKTESTAEDAPAAESGGGKQAPAAKSASRQESSSRTGWKRETVPADVSGGAESGETEAAPAAAASTNGTAPAGEAEAAAGSGKPAGGEQQKQPAQGNEVGVSSGSSGRGRRKASRPAGSVGQAPQPVVVSGSGSEDTERTVSSSDSSVVSVGPARRSGRRAAGRATGPPVRHSGE